MHYLVRYFDIRIRKLLLCETNCRAQNKMSHVTINRRNITRREFIESPFQASHVSRLVTDVRLYPSYFQLEAKSNIYWATFTYIMKCICSRSASLEQ